MAQLRVESEVLNAKIQASEASLEVLKQTEVSSAAGFVSGQVSSQKNLAQIHALEEEVELLKGAQIQASNELTRVQSDVEAKSSRIQALEASITQMKNENEEKALKVSELEIEVLELNESLEAAEDAREQTQSKLARLEEEWETAVKAKEAEKEAAANREEQLFQQQNLLKAEHAAQIQASSREHADLVKYLRAIEGKLTLAQEALTQSQTELEAAAHAHTQEIEAINKGFEQQEIKLTKKIQKICEELAVRAESIFPWRPITLMCDLRPRRPFTLLSLMLQRASTTDTLRRRSLALKSVPVNFVPLHLLILSCRPRRLRPTVLNFKSFELSQAQLSLKFRQPTRCP